MRKSDIDLGMPIKVNFTFFFTSTWGQINWLSLCPSSNEILRLSVRSARTSADVNNRKTLSTTN